MGSVLRGNDKGLLRVLRWACLAVLPLAVAGCGEPEPKPVAPQAPVRVLPGQWTITLRTTGYNFPGITAQEYAAQVGQQKEKALCLQVGDDGLPDVAALVGPQGDACRYTKGSAAKGRLSATVECAGDVSIVLEGNYRGDSVSLGSRMTQPRAAGGALRTTTDVSGTRTGDCAPT